MKERTGSDLPAHSRKIAALAVLGGASLTAGVYLATLAHLRPSSRPAASRRRLAGLQLPDHLFPPEAPGPPALPDQTGVPLRRPGTFLGGASLTAGVYLATLAHLRPSSRPAASRRKQPAMPVVGFVSGMPSSASERQAAAFLKGLSEETGYLEGQNVAVPPRGCYFQSRQPSCRACGQGRDNNNPDRLQRCQ